jgi:hypothetical protein
LLATAIIYVAAAATISAHAVLLLAGFRLMQTVWLPFCVTLAGISLPVIMAAAVLPLQSGSIAEFRLHNSWGKKQYLMRGPDK